jgi:hypothetical protein
MFVDLWTVVDFDELWFVVLSLLRYYGTIFDTVDIRGAGCDCGVWDYPILSAEDGISSELWRKSGVVANLLGVDVLFSYWICVFSVVARGDVCCYYLLFCDLFVVVVMGLVRNMTLFCLYLDWCSLRWNFFL